MARFGLEDRIDFAECITCSMENRFVPNEIKEEVKNRGAKKLSIRMATMDDVDAVLNIYRPYVENTAISFEYEVPDKEEFRRRMTRILANYPYLVAEFSGIIVGYAYAGPFKERVAYKHCVETTIYVNEKFKGTGIGRLLYNELEKYLKQIGIKNLYACVACTENEDEYLTNGSVTFHKKMGYSSVGIFHKCGYKFDRWYDMTFLEKLI